MARKRSFKRRERRQRSSSVLKRVGIGVAIAIPLLYFAFTKVFFDPFESSEPAFEELVPRDVDLFVRRQELQSDFAVFPTPALADRLTRSRPWRDLAGTEAWKALSWPAELEALRADVEAQFAQALLDPLADLFGHEVALAGRLPARGAGPAQYALMARISDRAKLAVEMLGFDFALERALPGATRTAVDDPDVPSVDYLRLDVPERGAFFYARVRDLLVAGRDEGLLRDILRQVDGGPDTSLGRSRLWADVPDDGAPPEDHLSLEFLVDGQQLVARSDKAEAPDPAEPGKDALVTALGRLIDVRRVGEVVGRLAVSEGLSLRAHAEIATVTGTGGTGGAGDAGAAGGAGGAAGASGGGAGAGGGLLGAPSFGVRERLTSVAGLLPGDTSALITMNVDLRRLLTTCVEALNPDVQTLLNDTIKGLARYSPTWKVDNLPGLISYLGRTLEDEITIAVRPLDHDVPAGSQPLPLIAIILRVKDLVLWNGLDDAVVRGHKELGLDPKAMFLQEEGVGTRKWLGVSALPMNEFAYIVLDRRTAVITTSNDFLREIVAIYTNSRSSLVTKTDVRGMVESFGDARGNLALWGSAEALARVLDPWADWLAEDETREDWVPVRLRLRTELLATDFKTWQGKEDEMPEADKARLEAELDRRIGAQEAERRGSLVPALAATLRDKLRWLGLLDAVAASLRLSEHDADLHVRATTVLGKRLP